MKILLVNSLYLPHEHGGAEKISRHLATELSARGHELVVASTQPVGSEAVSTIDGVRVHYIPVKSIYRPFDGNSRGLVQKAIWRLIDSNNVAMREPIRHLLEEERPDIVNTHNITGFSSAVWDVTHALGIPIAHTMHDQYLLCHRSTMFKRGNNCVTQCLDCKALCLRKKQSSRFVGVAIGVSTFIADRHLANGYFPNAEIRVINNPIPAYGQARTRIRTWNELRFGYLGQIIPTKGIELLVDSFLAAALPNAKLWIAGTHTSDYADSLRKTTIGSASIIWLGRVDPITFLDQIDILVVPSLWNDTAPLVILEALAQGIPLIGTNRGGIPELIPQGAGWIVDPNVPESLTKCMLTIHDDQSMLLAASEIARKYAESQKGVDWGSQYIEAFERILN